MRNLQNINSSNYLTEHPHYSTKILKGFKDRKWYALYTRPRCEKKVASELTEAGVEVFCPLIRTKRIWSDRKKDVSIPMFPSYIFVRIPENEREEILRHRFVINFVHWLGKPAVIRQAEIDAILRVVEHGHNIEVEGADLEIGDKFVIEEGIFKGMEAQVDRKAKNRLVLHFHQLNLNIRFEMKI